MSPTALIERYGWNTVAAQALNPGLRRWQGQLGLVAYAVGRRWPGGPVVWIAAGDPIAPPDRLAETAREFAAAADASGASVAWFAASERFRRTWTAGALVLGAQPVWAPSDWSHILASKSSLRQQVNRARNKGVTVRAWPAEHALELDPIRQAWLSRRGLPPLHFLADSDVLAVPGLRSFWVAEREGTPVAYLVALPIPARRGVFVEWIVQTPDAPNGTAARLVDTAFREFAAADVLSLGMVPLSTRAPLSEQTPTPHVRALLAWMRAHARRFYNFEGLERFKAKFQPREWEPLYLLTPSRRASLGLLHAVSDVFAGARTPERLVARALTSAVQNEARALRP